MGQLSQNLASYYKKGGNRILFNGGYSLNRLSLKMWDRLGFSQVDASVLSKVLKGKRLFSFGQLRVFCDILKIPQNERNMLFSSLNEDYLARYGKLSSDVISCGIRPYIDADKLVDSYFIEASKVRGKKVKSLVRRLIPREGDGSLIGIPFGRQSFYKLIEKCVTQKENYESSLAGYSVEIPICGFKKTAPDFNDNCHCSYHLALYGVLMEAGKVFKVKNRIQSEVGRWIYFFFPGWIVSKLV